MFFDVLCVHECHFRSKFVSVLICRVCCKASWTYRILSWSQPTTSRTLLMLKSIDTYSKQWVNTCCSTGRTWKLVSLVLYTHAYELCHIHIEQLIKQVIARIRLTEFEPNVVVSLWTVPVLFPRFL